MTDAERTHLDDTLAHIRKVQGYLHDVVGRLLGRARVHDRTKLEEPEFSSFAEVSARLNEVEYGSDEYQGLLDELESALDHHYAHTAHHPESIGGGIQGMGLVALTEMLCDWKAASERHEDGSIRDSIEKNQERFEYGDELKGVLHNTAQRLFPDEYTDE